MITSDELRRLEEGFRYGKVANCHFDFHEKTLEALGSLRYVLDLLGGSCDDLDLAEFKGVLEEQKRIEKELSKLGLDGIDDALEIVQKYYEITKVINS